ncbi:MAG: endopeptidase La [Nitrospinae bacterium]|nr:endopeptidase La [Nitrospinota bacterium]
MSADSGTHDVVAGEIPIPTEIPVLASDATVVYPYIVLPMAVSDIRARVIEEGLARNRIIGIFTLKQGEAPITHDNLHEVGTAALIARMLKIPDGTIQVLLQGLARIRLIALLQEHPTPLAKIEVIRESSERTTEIEALARNLTSLFQKIAQLTPHLPQEIAITAMNIPVPGQLADFVAANLALSVAEKQEILHTLNLSQRLRRLTEFANRELEILEIGEKIQAQAKGEMDKGQREYFLRKQLEAIHRELGEADDRSAEITELRGRLQGAGLPPEAMQEAERELGRLAKMSPASAEYTVARTYLDWLIGLPWQQSTPDVLDVQHAATILDADHFDLENVKDRILEYLAVRKLKPDMKGPILCFVGPPGVGKTSLGQSIARALGRTFMRMSLGGVRDEAEIRGHRRTYIGALPGRIIQGIQRAGSNNPVFMLDEVDKVGADFRGDPTAALLEVLDPEQNHAFMDHYLDLPFDLSKVLFIATANVLDPIPPALRDRMEVLELAGYTEMEKLAIARTYLLPRQLAEHGLSAAQLEVTDDGLLTLIRNYTREAGIRNMEREIGSICRKVARAIAQGWVEKTTVGADAIAAYLGPAKFQATLAEEGDEVGLATGLAWTPVGGDILFVEATPVPGKGALILTGHLGEVMRESAQAALTYTRSRAQALGIDPGFYEHADVHIHVPAGAIPKDGPSAGITITTALISALTKRAVRKDVGMTGEITLRGKVLPVGGIKEKVLAAHRAGIKTLILPRDNAKDLAELPAPVREDMQFILVSHMDEVIRAALRAEPQPTQAAVGV